MSHKILLVSMLVMIALGITVMIVDAQGPKGGTRKVAALAGTGFTYQGQLKNNGALVNGSCDFGFRLYDDSSAGNLLASAITKTIQITNGLFTTSLDLGGVITGGVAVWLDMRVGCPSPAGSFTTLSPRQALTPAPLAFALPGLYTTQNITSPNLIGGYRGNVISSTVTGGTIGGGGSSGDPNRVWDQYATVSGGHHNTAGGEGATIGGGYFNSTSNSYTTVGGGSSNYGTGEWATVGGGYINVASNNYATIGGGQHNTASNIHTTVGGGSSNTASNQYATVGGGRENSASGNASTIPGGSFNIASGDYSFAAGYFANTNNQSGSFVWGDNYVTDYISATAPNQFIVRATGGMGVGTNSPAAQLHVSSAGGFGIPQVYISQTNSADYARLRLTNGSASWDVSVGGISNTLSFYNGGNVLSLNSSGNPLTTAAGGYLTPGGAWTNASDRNNKANLLATNGTDVLARVVQLPISTWNYKAENEQARHMGPMAQDFRAAFGLGNDDKAITTVDEGGVALAAIQGLYQIVQENDAKITAQQNEIAQLKKQNADFESRLAALEHASPSARTQTNDWDLALAFVVGAIGVVAIERNRKGDSK